MMLVWYCDVICLFVMSGMIYGRGGLGSRSTLSRVKRSSLGSWQCCSGLSPGTLSASSNGAISGELPNRLAEAEVARTAEVRAVMNFMLAVVVVLPLLILLLELGRDAERDEGKQAAAVLEAGLGYGANNVR